MSSNDDNLPGNAVEEEDNLPANAVEEEAKLSAEAEADYALSRQVYRSLIEQGNRSMDDMIKVAQESEHPRAFEVLSTLIKTVGDVTDKLMDLQKSRQDILLAKNKRGVSARDDKSPTTNNTMFVGTTHELQRFMQEAREKDVTPDNNNED